MAHMMLFIDVYCWFKSSGVYIYSDGQSLIERILEKSEYSAVSDVLSMMNSLRSKRSRFIT